MYSVTSGHLGHRDRPADGLGLERGGAGPNEGFDWIDARRVCRIFEVVRREAVLGMHGRHPAGTAEDVERPHQLVVIGHPPELRVRHEHLERRDPRLDRSRDLARLLLRIEKAPMQAEVEERHPLALFAEVPNGLDETRPGLRVRVMNHRRHPAVGGRDGQRLEIVDVDRMRVDVNRAGKDVATRCIDDAIGLHLKAGADPLHGVAANEDVRELAPPLVDERSTGHKDRLNRTIAHGSDECTRAKTAAQGPRIEYPHRRP